MPKEKERTYECTICRGRSMGRRQSAGTPECCGQPMQEVPLEKCTLATTAEHARFDDANEPCDDGRSGKI